MNCNLIVPAVISAGLHVFVLGFKSSPTIAPPALDEPIELVHWEPTPIPDDLEPPIVLAPSDDIDPPKRASSLPGFEELPHVISFDPGVITIIRPPTPNIEGGPQTIIPVDWQPGGVGGPGGSPIALMSELENNPRALLRPAPVRPPGVRDTDARVTIEFVVGKDGLVTHARVVASSDSHFDEACLRAVRRWRFEPGIKRGLRVPFRVSQEFVFTTRD